YTDDAAVPLSVQMRRRCFNCCTTESRTPKGRSAWRRSKLSPGKVLCDKCGHFERNHNRTRP
ncbi:hypothetical protein B0H17DRAFT_899908, partial [Mycena rosella]